MLTVQERDDAIKKALEEEEKKVACHEKLIE